MLASYAGVYASPGVPLKITVSVNDGQLQAQATGQGAFLLEASSPTDFANPTFGIILLFQPEANQFILEQGGQKFTFTRE